MHVYAFIFINEEINCF